jgi:hypothetical protein
VSECWCTATSRLPRTGGSWCSEASSTGNTCPRKIRSAALPNPVSYSNLRQVDPCHFSIIMMKEKNEVLAEMITVVPCLPTKGDISSAFDLFLIVNSIQTGNTCQQKIRSAVFPVSPVQLCVRIDPCQFAIIIWKKLPHRRNNTLEFSLITDFVLL